MAGRRGGRRPAGDEQFDPVEGSYGDCDGESVFVIREPDAEGAWIAVEAGEEVSLSAHR